MTKGRGGKSGGESNWYPLSLLFCRWRFPYRVQLSFRMDFHDARSSDRVHLTLKADTCDLHFTTTPFDIHTMFYFFYLLFISLFFFSFYRFTCLSFNPQSQPNWEPCRIFTKKLATCPTVKRNRIRKPKIQSLNRWLNRNWCGMILKLCSTLGWENWTIYIW